MKRIVLLLTFIYCSYSRISAQSVDRFFILNGPAILQECDINGTIAPGMQRKLIPENLKFTILTIISDSYLISFWELANESQLSMEYSNLFGPGALIRPKLTNRQETVRSRYELSDLAIRNYATGNKRYFLIRKTLLDSVASKIVKRWSPVYGSAVLPFKLRTQTGEFKKDITISGLGGLKVSSTRGHLSFAAVTGIGITSVSVDSLSTFGVVKKSEDRAAITIPIGIVVEWRKLQLGIYSGADWLSKSNLDNWRYQGKNWWAIGIGFSIFSEEKPAKEESKN